MKLISPTSVLLKENIYKPKKGEPEKNPWVIWEAEVVASNDSRLKKGDKVIINRMGILDVKVGKKSFIIMDIADVLIKL